MSAAAEKTASQETEIKVSGTAKKVPASIFGAEVKPNSLHQVVRWQRAKARSGTHKTKTRSEVSGGGKKPFKQKGTGRARAGTTRGPLWVGGGTAHGPRPRGYTFDLKKKERKAALCGAISARNAEGKLFALKDLGLKEIKTSAALKALEKAGLDTNRNALIVAPKSDEVTLKSIKNISRVKTATPEGLNVYDIVGTQQLVIIGDALDQLVERLG